MIKNEELKGKLLRCIDHISFAFGNFLWRDLILVPYYHVVSDSKLPHIENLHSFKGIKQFISDVEFLMRNYKPILLPELIKVIKNREKIKDRVFLLTFDDGYKEVYEIVAPILYKKGIPAIFFINTDFLDNKDLSYKNKASLIIDHFKKKPHYTNILIQKCKIFSGKSQMGIINTILSISYKQKTILDEIANILEIDFYDYLKTHQPFMTKEQIARLVKDGFYIGAHSKDHPNYSELSLEDQVHQTIESIRIVKQYFSLSYAVFSYPYGVPGNSEEYLNIIRKEVDLTFSTSNQLDPKVFWNIPRINFERSLLPARSILTYHGIKNLIKKTEIYLKK